MSFEAELNEGEGWKTPFMKLSRIWNGWSATKKRTLKILEKIKDRYRFRFYPDQVLAQTDKLFLYNVNVNFLIHHRGIEEMFNAESKTIKNIFTKHRNKGPSVTGRITPTMFSGHRRFLRLRKNYHKALQKNKFSRASEMSLRALSLMERKLTVEGMAKLVGGEENMYIFSRIEGFRIGDEDGDRPYFSNSIGEFGEMGLLGPTERMQRHTGMVEAEFYISWLTGRLL